MFTQNFVSAVVLLIGSSSAFASWRCESAKYLRQTGAKRPAQGRLAFDEAANAKGDRVLKNVHGVLNLSSEIVAEGKPPKDVIFDHTGVFSVAEITENPNYDSNIYKGYSEFRNFDTPRATGAGSAMAGRLLVEGNPANNKTQLKVSYLFQVSDRQGVIDHMGGTLDFICSVK